MKNLSFMTMIVAATLLVSCNHTAKPAETQEKMKTADPNKGIKMSVTQLASNKDLNCGMTLEDGTIGDTASYNGKIYGFCSAECKAEFVKNPQALIDKK